MSHLRSLILLERVVFESLCRCKKTLPRLKDDTGISKKVLMPILETFIRNGDCLNHNDEFVLTEKGRALNKEITVEAKKSEAIEFFSTFYDKSHLGGQTKLQMKKIWMSEYDRMLYVQIIEQWESFIKKIQHNNRHRKLTGKKSGKLYEQMVILWGATNYRELIEQSQLIA